MASTRKLFAALARRGPHQVLRGDLAFAGLPGLVYTPESGLSLPGVAFGHDWLTATQRYESTLEHLASWGIVAAAPDTEGGLVPSALNLAADLGTALEIIGGVRLGPGQISVHQSKLGVVGHGFGGSAAVLAAMERIGKPGLAPKTAVAIFPTVTKPAVENMASALTIPGLVLSAPGDPVTLRSNAVGLARAWDGAVLRTVSKAKADGLPDGKRLLRVIGLPGADRGTQKAVRAVLTGYLLYQLAGDKTYSDFADPQAPLPKTELLDPEADPVKIEDKVVALLKQ